MVWKNLEIGRSGQFVFPISGLRLKAAAGEIFLLPEAIVAILQRRLRKIVRSLGVERCSDLCGNQFRDADQVGGDEVQQDSSGDTSNPAMLRLAHRAMLLAPAKDAFDHFAALLRHPIARVPCRAGIDPASPPLADLLAILAGPLFCATCGVRLMARKSSTWPFNMALQHGPSYHRPCPRRP